MRSGELRHQQQREPLLPELHVVGGEEAVAALAHAAPPAVVDHLDVGDDVVGVEGDLVVTRCRESPTGSAPTQARARNGPSTRVEELFGNSHRSHKQHPVTRTSVSPLPLNPQIPDFSLAATRGIKKAKEKSTFISCRTEFSKPKGENKSFAHQLGNRKGLWL